MSFSNDYSSVHFSEKHEQTKMVSKILNKKLENRKFFFQLYFVAVLCCLSFVDFSFNLWQKKVLSMPGIKNKNYHLSTLKKKKKHKGNVLSTLFFKTHCIYMGEMILTLLCLLRFFRILQMIFKPSFHWYVCFTDKRRLFSI